MDELAAAAAVLAMDVASENAEDAVLEATSLRDRLAVGHELEVESLTIDKENQGDLPADRRVGAAISKVISHR